MASELRTSQAGLMLIMAYEGFRSHSKQLPDGRWVIGYGHLKAARQGLRVSQAEASAILREFDLPPIEQALRDLLLVPVNQNEFDALVSFTFNIGIDQFADSSVLAHLNAGRRLDAAAAMERWSRIRLGMRDMVVDPLVRRRADEKALFLKTVGSVPLAASSRFRPTEDTGQTEAFRDNSAFSIVEGLPESLPSDAVPADGRQEGETATEAAARNVRERLTRILGEQESGMPVEPEQVTRPVSREGKETTVEDIRKAISALVSDDDEQTLPSGDIALDEIDLDNTRATVSRGAGSSVDVDPASLEEVGSAVRPDGRPYIDDVSPIKIPPADPTLHRGPDRVGLGELFLFILAALLGAALFACGGALKFGWFGHEGTVTDLLPPFLMLSGGLLFVIMAYYAVRALSSRT